MIGIAFSFHVKEAQEITNINMQAYPEDSTPMGTKYLFLPINTATVDYLELGLVFLIFNYNFS